MENGSASPPKHYRIANLKGFLPLSEEASLSTRGQHLPSLLSRNLSSGNVKGLVRRHSRAAPPDDLDDIEANSIHRVGSDPGHGHHEDRDDRRKNMAPSSLKTPQMRSQRLIGNSNPRYRWEQYYKSEEELKRMKKPIRGYY
ncbi:hypothetical protein LTS18_010731, partial [Coniosporium uncinatum]